MNEESIFAAAIGIASPAERAAFLDEACASDPKLRASIDALLKANSEAGEFLSGHPGAAPTIFSTPAEGDTHDSSDSSISMPYLDPCDAPNRIGRLGHYEIIELVGRGGMGSVLRAFDSKLVRIVAVKVMAPELAANPTAVKRFLREAQTAAAVHHDNVVTIHAIEETHRPPYLVMQFVEGQTLQQKIDREGVLDLIRILRIGAQTAAGLAAAHKHGLIHRDVKPANILLENGVERVKITDFGLARAADDMEMTQTGVIAGTPQYMSPEQAMGVVIDVRSDLFSLGSVLYSMCTGRPAFRAETTMGVLKRVCEDSPRPISEVNPSLPPWLSAIVARLLAKNPADRFQSAREVAELLEKYLAHVQNPASAPRPETIFVPSPMPVWRPAAGKPPQMLAPGANGAARTSRFSTATIVIGIVLGICACGIIPAAIVALGLMSPSLQMRQEGGGMAGVARFADPPLVDLREWGEFVDPVRNCELHREERRVRFDLPGSIAYNLLPTSEDGVNAPRLLQSVEGDFDVQCVVPEFPRPLSGVSTAGIDTASWRSAGLVVAIDDRSLLRLERASWAERLQGKPHVHAEWFADGKKLSDFYQSLDRDGSQPLSLRIEKRDAQLSLYFKDGDSRWEHWITVANMTFPKQVRVGLVAVQTTPTEFSPWFENVGLQAGPQATFAGPAPVHRIPGWGASWSPDSQSLVRHDSTQIEQYPTGSLERFDLATGFSKRIAPRGKDPSWSPVAGGPIAYVIETRNGPSNVWVCDENGAGARVVSDGFFVAGWSPDGAKLYDFDLQTRRLRLIDWASPATPPETLFTFETPMGSNYPVVSPDGKRVGFHSKQDGKSRFVVREIATGANVAASGDLDTDLLLGGWSPDGRRVAFGSYTDRSSGMWMLDLTSGETRKVLEGNRTFPRWSPDGKLVAVDVRDRAEVWVYDIKDLDP